MEWFKEFLRPEVLWFLIGVILLVMELMVPGLIIFFFGLGACFTAAICYFYPTITLNMQIILFLIASIVFLVCLRWWLRKIFSGLTATKKELGEHRSEFIGEKATVIEAIAPGRRGKVEFHGTDWQAEAERTIEPGTVVEIIGQDNIVLKVQ